MRSKNAANGWRNRIISRHCKNFCRDAAGRRPNTVWREKAGRTTGRNSRWRYGWTASAWQPGRATRRKKPNSRRRTGRSSGWRLPKHEDSHDAGSGSGITSRKEKSGAARRHHGRGVYRVAPGDRTSGAVWDQLHHPGVQDSFSLDGAHVSDLLVGGRDEQRLFRFRFLGPADKHFRYPGAPAGSDALEPHAAYRALNP